LTENNPFSYLDETQKLYIPQLFFNVFIFLLLARYVPNVAKEEL